MSIHVVQSDLEIGRNVRAAVVRLINVNGVAAVTAAALCAEAEITAEQFSARYPTVKDAFVDFVRSLAATYGENIAGTLKRRRSLNESILLANMAFLEVVREMPTEHLALASLRVADIAHQGLVVLDPGASLHQTFVANSESWLIEIGRLHDVVWELPEAQLARQQVAVMTGVVMDFLDTANFEAAAHQLEVASFDLARRARRRAKNRKY